MLKPVIICVDDEPTVLNSLKIELKQAVRDQCLIETAESGQEALEIFDEFNQGVYRVALVVADYIMPGLKGDELLKQVHLRSPQTLNIMLTGQADLEAVSNAVRDARLYRYIAKPWEPEDLCLTVEEALQSYLKDRTIEAQTQQLRVLNQQLQQFNTHLEQQVQARTAELQQRIQEVEALSQLKDNLLHAVSHDLRTPLMGMLMVLQDLQKKPEDPLRVPQSVVQRMIQSSERQLQMLNSLLEVQRSETQSFQPKTEPLNLGQLVQGITQDLEPLITASQATLVNLIDDNLPLVQADPAQLMRVFENLMTNALKHNPYGITITLSAELTDSGSMIRCSVRDNGVGIPPEECATLFERYTRTIRSRRSPGIGLGLYLCRQIITAHGGQINVRSAVGEGTEFWFTLPLAKPDEPAQTV
jgi:signal transduction histidine kinase